MSLGINQMQLHGFQQFWQGQERMGVAPSSEARGVDAYRAQQMQEQVALQTAEGAISRLGEFVSGLRDSFFGGLEPQPAGEAEAPAAEAPVAEAPQAGQDAAIEALKATGNENLGYGSSGPEVEALQQMLKDEGYDLGDAGVDGKFGPKTKEAVEAYQRDKAAEASDPEQALKVDGIVGAQTRAALGNDALERGKEMDDTVAKLGEGGSRGGPDELRAEKAKEAKVDSVMDNHAERNAAPAAKEKADSPAPSKSESDGGGSKGVEV